jgi:hypothetical protein
MKTILIKRTGDSFQYKTEPNNAYWQYLPTNITTAAQIRQFFAEGRHSNAAWQSWRDVELKYVDINGENYQHYSVTQAGKFHQAVVNYDDSKKLMFTTDELWPSNERINYLCTNAVHLPSELHDNVDKALAYLAENEPFTVKEYDQQLRQKIKDKITERCEQHAQGSASYADVEFTD